MILYHFTSESTWAQIDRGNVLKPTDPALVKFPETPTAVISDGAGRYALAHVRAGGRLEPATEWTARATPPLLYDLIPGEHDLGPLVVHLTTDHRDCSAVTTEKLAVRIAVEVSDAHPWIRWARAHGIDEAWVTELRRGHADAKSWYVVERPIPRAEWVDVLAMAEYDTLWERPNTSA